MTLQESAVIYSNHRTRGIFIFLIILSVIFPFALTLAPHLYPETGEKNITVKFEYKGAYEKDIEKLIDKLEQPLSSLSGLESVYSVSEAEKGSVYLSFSEKKDLDEAYMEVRDCVKRVYTVFPENVQRPVLLKSGLNSFPVFAASFNTDVSADRRELERVFKEVKGCSDVETGGEGGEEIFIIPDTEKIHSSVFSFSSIIDRIRGENSSLVITPPGSRQVKAGEKIKGAGDLEKIYLSDSIKITDYSFIKLKSKEPESEGRIYGEKRIILYAMKEGESSVIEVCRELTKAAEKLGGEIVFSRGEEIEKALLETALSVAAGITAVVITALLYFRNIYLSLLVILNILFSVTASAAFLKMTNHSLDVITLSGMAVVSGLAIDNTIIFLEKYRLKMGNVEKAITETIYPLLFSLFTTCVVFVPLVFASLKLKTMFSGMAVSVSSGLASSFLFTFYFVPLFLNHRTDGKCALKTGDKDEYREASAERGTGRFRRCLMETAAKLLDKTVKIHTFSSFLPLLILIILSSAAFFMFSFVEYRSFSFESSSRLTLLIEFPSGSSFRYLKKTAHAVERELLDYALRIDPLSGSSGYLLQKGGFSIVLKTEKERARFDIKVPEKKYINLIRKKTDEISLKYRDLYFHSPLSETDDNCYDITIFGHDIDKTASDAYRLGRDIEAKQGTLKAVYHFKEPPEGLKTVISSKTASASSISPDSAARYIYTLLTSPVISKYYSDGIERDIRFGSPSFFTPDILKKLLLPGSSGSDNSSAAALEDIADFVPDFSPDRIYHRNRQRSVSMSVTGVSGRKDISVIETVLSDYDFTDGCRGEGGVIYHEKKGERGELVLLISLAFFFIITVLVIQFESFRIPVLITAGIPASFILPLAVILLTGTGFNVSTALALILSSGICVNNAILVLSPFRGRDVITPEMITSSLLEKTGAVLAASFTTVLSILPLVFTGADSLLAPFSITLSSGIIGSLSVLPVVVFACCMYYR